MQIRVKQYSFPISEPFQEGHRLSAGEAQALNKLRAENIRNNLARVVEAATVDLPAGGLLSTEAEARLAARVKRYDEGYQFELKTVSTKLAAVEVEIRRVAEEQFDILQRQTGEQISEETREERVRELERFASVITEARERVELRARVAASSLEDLL